MPSQSVEDLRWRASRLYRFVTQLHDVVREARGVRAYPAESEKFLEYVLDVAKGTRKFLDEKLPHEFLSASSKEENREALGNTLAGLEGGWTSLNEFIKPVVDADALHIAPPLLSLLQRRASEVLKKNGSAPTVSVAVVSGGEECVFRPGTSDDGPIIAIELLSVLNFIQIRRANLQDIDQEMFGALGSEYAPRLPTGLGIVGVPYSFGTTLFMNCLVFHELGHYVFERWRKDGKDLYEWLFAQLVPTILKRFPSVDAHTQRALYDGILLPWWEEIFCDLFAARMVGPVFTFLLWDLLSLIRLTRRESRATPEHFHPRHPSDMVRYAEQILLLDQLGWLQILRDLGVPVLDDTKQALGIRLANGQLEHQVPQEPYAPDSPLQGLSADFVRVFLDGVDAVRGLVNEVTGGVGRPEPCFKKEYGEIVKCLEHGVVPSALYLNPPTTLDRVVTLINSAYLFQLSPMDNLFKIVRDAKQQSIAHNARLRQRVEEWTLKAISDLL